MILFVCAAPCHWISESRHAGCFCGNLQLPYLLVLTYTYNRRKKPRLILLMLCLQGHVSAFVFLPRGISGFFCTAYGLPYALKQPSGLLLRPSLPHLLYMSAGRDPHTGFSPKKLPYSCPFTAVWCCLSLDLPTWPWLCRRCYQCLLSKE